MLEPLGRFGSPEQLRKAGTRQHAEILEPRRMLKGQLEALLEAHPLARIPASMPGVGVRIAATMLVTVGDRATFPDADHLASYAGLSPAAKSSGSSIKGERAPRHGNRQLNGHQRGTAAA